MSMLSRFAATGGGITDPYWANVSYLLVGNGANGTTTNIKDSSSNNLTTTINGNTVISTAQSKYDSGSVYFDGTGDYLSVPSASTGFSGNFTVDGWAYYTGTSGYATIFDSRQSGSYFGILLYINIDASSINVTVGSNTVIITGSKPPANTWFFFALSRNGSSIYLFINGVQVGSIATNSTSFSATTLFIGAFCDPYATFKGYLYDFRVTKNVARYTANFTPPTAAFPTN